jgi:hypothetical protein
MNPNLKPMKFKTFILALLFTSTCSFAQKKDSLQVKISFFKEFRIIENKPTYLFKIEDVQKKIWVTLFNKNTNLLDVFYRKNDSIVYQKSAFIMHANFVNPTIDSFNPYGVSDAKIGLAMGAVGSFFQLIFKK